jgi:hypothetical protein
MVISVLNLVASTFYYLMSQTRTGTPICPPRDLWCKVGMNEIPSYVFVSWFVYGNVIFILLTIWMFGAWFGYKNINHLSKTRTLLSMCIFIVPAGIALHLALTLRNFALATQ